MKILKRTGLALAVLTVLGGGWAYVSYAQWHAAQSERLQSGSEVAQTAKGPMEYALTGEGDRTLMLVHGSPGGYDNGSSLLDILPRGFRLLRVSRPGYLRTPLSTGESPAAQADAYAALLDTLGIERVNIVGASGGGPSSAQFAARHAERCESLVMMVAVAKPWEADRAKRKKTPPNIIRRFFLGTDLGGWLLTGMMERNPRIVMGPLGPEATERVMADPKKLASYKDLAGGSFLLASRRTAGYLNDMKWFGEMPPIPLDQIKAPTLVVQAGKDTSSLEDSQHVVVQVPGATRVVIEDAGHFVMITHRDETFGPIFEMYERIARPAAAPSADAAN